MYSATICPLCKQDNDCGNLKPGSSECWCMNEKIDAELLKQISTSSQGKSCICRSCALSYNITPSNIKAARGERAPMIELKESLQFTEFLDFTHPLVSEFVTRHLPIDGDDTEKAVQLYYAVRDGFRYDPYMFSTNPKTFKASYTIEQGRGWCVPKATLLAACCRAVGIPARLGFADVKNHMSTARLREMMQTDVFAWHGYTSIYLNNKWVKATPAFNIELCNKFKLKPLEFNGHDDSLYHEFDQAGNKHMEYLLDRGEYVDLPLDNILASYADIYNNRLTSSKISAADFDADVDSEHSA